MYPSKLACLYCMYYQNIRVFTFWPEMIHQVQFDVARLASYGVIHGSSIDNIDSVTESILSMVPGNITASRPSKYAEYLRLMPWSITLYVKLVFHLLSCLCHSYAHARFCHSRWRRSNARVRCYVISGVVHTEGK